MVFGLARIEENGSAGVEVDVEPGAEAGVESEPEPEPDPEPGIGVWADPGVDDSVETVRVVSVAAVVGVGVSAIAVAKLSTVF